MKCKYCDAELVEGKPFCPSCGKSQEDIPEETPVAEAPAAEASAEEKPEIKEGAKATPGKIALAVAAVVVILAVLIAVIASGMGGGNSDATEPVATVEATEQTVEYTIPADGNPDDETCKGTYTVTDDLLVAAKDTVVATVGDAELTVGQLQIYYWEEVYNLLNTYGDYVAYVGLDVTQPLDVQICQFAETTMTWQQYFLSCALDNWYTYQALALEGEATGFEPEEDYLAYLEALPETLESNAQTNGYGSTAELVEALVGPGTTVEDYIAYIKLYNDGYLYFGEQYESLIPTEEQVNTYFAENEESYAASGITKDSGKYVDVRHVLIMPNDENATTGEDGYPVYSQEAWDACLEEAQKLYDEWKAGDMSEDSFAELANTYSADSDGTDGGLYTEVTEGYMVENFNDWCFDEARQYGDHDLIQTQYGYHIMFFVDSYDIWYATAEYDYISEMASNLVPTVKEKYPLTVDYSSIVLCFIDLVEGR